MVVERRDDEEKVDLSPFSLIPKYDRLSLFLLSILFILLPVCYRDAINEIREHSLASIGNYALYIEISVFVGGFIVLGGLFSIFRIFYQEIPTMTERICMRIFAAIANGIAALFCGIYIWDSFNRFFMILAVLNVITSVLMLAECALLPLYYSTSDYTQLSYQDTRHSVTEIYASSFAVSFIFLFCYFVFELYWALNLSICLIYANSIDPAIRRVVAGNNPK